MYCADNGRPPLDPTLLFKALFVGYLSDIRSERQLVREIEVDAAYRRFLRLKLTQKLFDASTLPQSRRHRNETVAQAIFDHIVEQAMAPGLVGGRTLHTDPTHPKASANKSRFDIETVRKSLAAYWAALRPFPRLIRVKVQCLLAATVQNIKKIALVTAPA